MWGIQVCSVKKVMDKVIFNSKKAKMVGENLKNCSSIKITVMKFTSAIEIISLLMKHFFVFTLRCFVH